MALKLTVFFGLDNYSWSEAVYLTTGVSPSDGVPAAIAYVNKRINLCGVGVFIINVRISTVPANRFTLDVDPSLYVPFPFQTAPPTTDPTEFSADRAYSSLLVYMTGAPFSRRMYLAGIPDSIIGEGPDFTKGFNRGDSPFTKYFKQWATLLGSGAYGFRVRNKATDVPAQKPLIVSADVPPEIGVSTPAPLLIPAPVGRNVQAGDDLYLSGWKRISTRYPGLNGTFRVAAVQIQPGPPAYFSYFLQGTASVSPTNFYGMGKIGPAVYQIQTIDAGSVVALKAVAHKRGGSYALPRGRSRTRS